MIHVLVARKQFLLFSSNKFCIMKLLFIWWTYIFCRLSWCFEFLHLFWCIKSQSEWIPLFLIPRRLRYRCHHDRPSLEPFTSMCHKYAITDSQNPIDIFIYNVIYSAIFTERFWKIYSQTGVPSVVIFKDILRLRFFKQCLEI